MGSSKMLEGEARGSMRNEDRELVQRGKEAFEIAYALSFMAPPLASGSREGREVSPGARPAMMGSCRTISHASACV